MLRVADRTAETMPSRTACPSLFRLRNLQKTQCLNTYNSGLLVSSETKTALINMHVTHHNKWTTGVYLKGARFAMIRRAGVGCSPQTICGEPVRVPRRRDGESERRVTPREGHTALPPVALEASSSHTHTRGSYSLLFPSPWFIYKQLLARIPSSVLILLEALHTNFSRKKI